MSYLRRVDNQINSLKSNQEKIKDTIGQFQNKIYTLKRGSNKTLDYGDKWVVKAKNKIIVFKRKRARLT